MFRTGETGTPFRPHVFIASLRNADFRNLRSSAFICGWLNSRTGRVTAMSVSDIPAINAVLNGISTVLMTAGFICIMRRRITAHRAFMLSAGAVSAVFLIGYVTHKALVRGVHTPFGGEGAIRTVYYVMLVTHILLAMAIAYLVPRTFFLALKGDFVRHRAWARWTFPIWYYVSITGVLVYLFLYVWWPAP